MSADLEENDESVEMPPIATQKITLKLIMDRNLSNIKFAKSLQMRIHSENGGGGDVAEMKAKELLKLTHIHLDRERIEEIDNLAEYLGNITHLYLQSNLIKRIDNLDFFHSLKFLVLSQNKIERVENLKMLINLKLLDLSFNLIERVDVDELPVSLVFLDLRNNPCNGADWEQTETRIRGYLSKLVQLNGEEIEDEDKQESEIGGDLNSLSSKMIERSKLRQKSDVANFDKIWVQREAKLNSFRQSLQDNFNIKM